MTPTVRVAVEPGTGRLARAPHGVLFVPSAGNGLAALLDAFLAADGPGVADAVTQVVVDAGFDVPPFTCLTWHDRVSVLVLGDVQVRTDHPALPMLSGAASETWVEHTLRAGPETVTLHVEGPTDDDTDLRGGIVPAGGFRVTVTTPTPAGATAPGPIPPPTPDPIPPPTPDPIPPPTPGPIPPPTPDLDPDPASAVTAPAPIPTVDADDPDASLAAIQAAAVTEDRPGAAAPVAPAPATGALVEAVTCPAGHLDRPGASTCRVCGEPIPADAAVATHPRPAMGTLQVEGGTSHRLDGDVVLGRRPRAEGGQSTLAVPGEKASRTHAEVTVRGWDVYVRDLGSTNGTHLVARDGDEPFTLAPDVPTRILPGAVVYVGSTAVRFAPPDP